MSTTSCGINENGTLTKDRDSSRTGHIGDIIAFYGSTAPEGTLVCNGAAISRTTYSELFGVIGTTAGAGDGSTTFNLPDLRGKWLMGADEEHNAGTEVEEGLPNIEGTFVLWGSPKTGCFYATATFETIDVGATGGYDCKRGTCGFDASRASAIYGASQHVTPASVAVLPCIIYE